MGRLSEGSMEITKTITDCPFQVKMSVDYDADTDIKLGVMDKYRRFSSSRGLSCIDP